jgi:hypothetical protein
MGIKVLLPCLQHILIAAYLPTFFMIGVINLFFHITKKLRFSSFCCIIFISGILFFFYYLQKGENMFVSDKSYLKSIKNITIIKSAIAHTHIART